MGSALSIGHRVTLLQEERLFMAIKYISGDLFENRFGAEAIGHGCNLQGSMGAGIAKIIKERYPEMYEEYRCGSIWTTRSCGKKRINHGYSI
jgi:O-acetyl-ADP-ribose deacetylase (regulator of RNase III)